MIKMRDKNIEQLKKHLKIQATLKKFINNGNLKNMEDYVNLLENFTKF